MIGCAFADAHPTFVGPGPLLDGYRNIERMTQPDANRSSDPIFIGLLLLIALLGSVDLVLDSPSAWLSVHVAVDLGLVVLCLGTGLYLLRAWYRSRRSLTQVQQMLAERRAERDLWKERTETLLKGLGQAIDEQLTTWKLTPTEHQIAFLLLKGYSHKEIARIGERSERTVRQHAVAVYRKSGLAGRAELSAYFLEDLFQPSGATG